MCVRERKREEEGIERGVKRERAYLRGGYSKGTAIQHVVGLTYQMRDSEKLCGRTAVGVTMEKASLL